MEDYFEHPFNESYFGLFELSKETESYSYINVNIMFVKISINIIGIKIF